MKKLILLVFLFASSCAHTDLSDVWDTCPSTEGMSCPEDGSPCPFCGKTKKLISHDR